MVQPGADTIELTLNGPALIFTALVDPRAPVHVSTGVLPTATLEIPPDQYLRAMQQLAQVVGAADPAMPQSVPPPAMAPPAPSSAPLTNDTFSAEAGLPSRSRRWVVPAVVMGGLAAAAVALVLALIFLHEQLAAWRDDPAVTRILVTAAGDLLADSEGVAFVPGGWAGFGCWGG